MTITKICQCCQKEFTAQRTATKYCSHACNSKDYKLNIRINNIETNNKATETIKRTDAKIKAWQPLQGIDFLTVKEVSILLRCSVMTTYRLVRNGTIKAVNLSERKTLIRRSDIEKIFDNKQP